MLNKKELGLPWKYSLGFVEDSEGDPKMVLTCVEDSRIDFAIHAANNYHALVEALEAWMKVESEMADNHPCPDYTLRALYRKEAVKLTTKALLAFQAKKGDSNGS